MNYDIHTSEGIEGHEAPAAAKLMCEVGCVSMSHVPIRQDGGQPVRPTEVRHGLGPREDHP